MFDFDVVTGPMPDPGAKRGEKREPKSPGLPARGMDPAAAGEAGGADSGAVAGPDRPDDPHFG